MADKEHFIEGIAGGGGAVLSLLLTYPILTVTPLSIDKQYILLFRIW